MCTSWVRIKVRGYEAELRGAFSTLTDETNRIPHEWGWIRRTWNNFLTFLPPVLVAIASLTVL